ncbi:BrnT family toxin, partial [Brachyspira catarrhinii]
ISFEEAIFVFTDDNAIIIKDAEHSINEERFITIGRIKGFYIIVVVYTDRTKYNDKKETIRIISSRYATKKEIKQYIDFNSRRGK